MHKELLITNDNILNERADLYLSKVFTDYTRSYFLNAIIDGRVKVNNTLIKPSYKFKIGDNVSIDFKSIGIENIKAEDIPLDIIYEDDDILVINKKKGIVVHPSPGHENGTIVNAILNHCKDNLSGINGIIRPGIVHRIDKDTSGVLLICKNDYSHNFIATQFKDHKNLKKYKCIVHGRFDNDVFEINKPIDRNKKDRKKMAIAKDGSGRDALTIVKVIKEYTKYSLIECTLKTGRTHQIRVHLSSVHHPIICDKIYGKEDREFGIEGQCLHSETLGIIHLRTKEYMEFNAPMPEYFLNVIKILEQKYV